METRHPYYPLGVEIPGYIENELPFTTCLTILGSALTSILFLVWRVTKYTRPDLPRHEVLTVLWFALCK
jgi:cholestenol delta-isomerase